MQTMSTTRNLTLAFKSAIELDDDETLVGVDESVKFEINGGILSGGYELTAPRIISKDTVTVGFQSAERAVASLPKQATSGSSPKHQAI